MRSWVVLERDERVGLTLSKYSQQFWIQNNIPLRGYKFTFLQVAALLISKKETCTDLIIIYKMICEIMKFYVQDIYIFIL